MNQIFQQYRHKLMAVRRSYTAEARQAEWHSDLPAYVLYRPLSFWITPLFLALGWSANAVTVLSLLIGLALPLAAWWCGAQGYWLVVSLGLFFQVLDCVDGNMARTLGTASRVGRLLDSITTLLYWTAYIIAVGILAHNAAAGWIGQHGLVIGLGLAVLFLAQRELEDTFDAYFDERVRWGPPPLPQQPDFDWSRFGRPLEHLYAFVVLAVAGVGGWLDLFLGVLATYQLVLLGIWLPRFIKAIRTQTTTSQGAPG